MVTLDEHYRPMEHYRVPCGWKPHWDAALSPSRRLVLGCREGCACGAEWVCPEWEALVAPERKPPPPGEPPLRAAVLDEAKALITGDRNAQYGPPAQDFARTAGLLNALGYRREDAGGGVHAIAASDIGLIMIQLKMSRVMHSRNKRDHYTDIAGYAGCAYECAAKENENA